MPTQSEWGEEKVDMLLGAVNVLISSPRAHELIAALEAAYSVAKIHPIKLTGEAAAINPLLDLKLNDVNSFNNVITLVERKRQELGYDPLIVPKSDKFDKTDYMRQFMDKKRERQRRAAIIENMMRPERDVLRGRARLDFMDRQSSKWKRELDALMAKAREAHGGRLTKEQLDVIREQFWSGVDRYLDQLEEAARSELKRASGANPRKVAASLDQLHAALATDPYAARP